jgi:hypothetical protein
LILIVNCTFAQNLAQQVSYLNQITQPRQLMQVSQSTLNTHSSEPTAGALDISQQAPLPVIVQNPRADNQEIAVQKSVQLSLDALQNTIGDENRLRTKIAQLGQQQSANNASTIAALTKQLNNAVAVEKQDRTNIDGWNKYLLSYEHFSSDASENTPYADSSSVSSGDTDDGPVSPPADPVIQQMQAQLLAQQYADQQAQQQQAQQYAKDQQAQAQAQAQAQEQQQQAQEQAQEWAQQQAQQQGQQQAQQQADQQAQQEQAQQQADQQAEQQAEQAREQQQQADQEAQQEAQQLAQQQADQQAQQQQAQLQSLLGS